MNMDDYFRSTPEERARIDQQRPPSVHTHRRPGRISSADVLASRRRLTDYTPTHRGEPRPILTELATVNSLLAASGKEPHRA